jgi:hypothetical protein
MGISRLLLPWALLRVVVRSRLAAAQARVQSRLEDGLPEWKAAGPVHRDHGFLNGACIWSRYEEYAQSALKTARAPPSWCIYSWLEYPLGAVATAALTPPRPDKHPGRKPISYARAGLILAVIDTRCGSADNCLRRPHRALLCGRRRGAAARSTTHVRRIPGGIYGSFLLPLHRAQI